MRLYSKLTIIAFFMFALSFPANSYVPVVHDLGNITDSISTDQSNSFITSVPWPFGPDPNTDDDEESEESESEESPEQPDQKPEENDDPDEESDSFSFFDPQDPFYDDYDDSEYDDDQNNGKNIARVNPELYRQNPMTEWEWADVAGDKVPFFFFLDSRSPGLFESDEPRTAYFKALKYAGEILNGVPFRYEPRSDEVYLIGNISQVPDLIFMTNRIDYSEATRFDYEIAFQETSYESKKSGVRVAAHAKETGSSIANSFELTRKEAFSRAIRDAYGRERSRNNWDINDIKTGTVTAWEIIDHGWLNDENMYYLSIRFWISFD